VACSERLLGEIETLCYMVKRGAKPAALVPVQSRYIKILADFIEKDWGLNIHAEQLSDGWHSLWIFKYSHILDVIKSLPKVPSTPFDHWVLGKLFGYSEEAIQEHLTNQPTLVNEVPLHFGQGGRVSE